MKAGPVVTLFVCALAVGWLAPGLRTAHVNGDTVAPEPSPVPEARLEVSHTDQWLAGQTVLSRQHDGHFYTDAIVDGVKLRFLVDTGASFVALTGEDAEALGLEWDEAEVRPVARGANGIVHGVTVRLDRIEIGGIEARGVDAAIIPEGLDISLLGQSFLSQIANVQIRGDEMRLGG